MTTYFRELKDMRLRRKHRRWKRRARKQGISLFDYFMRRLAETGG